MWSEPQENFLMFRVKTSMILYFIFFISQVGIRNFKRCIDNDSTWDAIIVRRFRTARNMPKTKAQFVCTLRTKYEYQKMAMWKATVGRMTLLRVINTLEALVPKGRLLKWNNFICYSQGYRNLKVDDPRPKYVYFHVNSLRKIPCRFLES